MRRLIVPSLALVGFVFVLASPAAAVTVTITGPANVWVPFGECVTVSWTASTDVAVDTYDWAFDGTHVSSTSGYSRRFCSPEEDCISRTTHKLEVWVTVGSERDYDSHNVTVLYQAGTLSGPCGFDICCF